MPFNDLSPISTVFPTLGESLFFYMQSPIVSTGEGLHEVVGPSGTSKSINSSAFERRARIGSARARAACTVCRWRKVRCDAQEKQPCTTCKFERIECVLPPTKRRRLDYHLCPDQHRFTGLYKGYVLFSILIMTLGSPTLCNPTTSPRQEDG